MAIPSFSELEQEQPRPSNDIEVFYTSRLREKCEEEMRWECNRKALLSGKSIRIHAGTVQWRGSTMKCYWYAHTYIKAELEAAGYAVEVDFGRGDLVIRRR